MAIMEILSSLQSNPYFGAGFGLVGVGAGVAFLRKSFILGTVLFKRNCMITLEVPGQDKSYHWLLQWINMNSRNTQHISVKTGYDVDKSGSGKVSTSFAFVPSVGVHYFNYKNNIIQVERNREQIVDLTSGQPFESVKLSSIGRNRRLFINILNEARDIALKEQIGKTVIYTALGHEWKEFGHPRKRRPLNSVVLEENQTNRILRDVKEFLSTETWYSSRGIPYRRGYLLYGPPGCGKTSFITALAGHLEYNICILNLSNRHLSDDRLNHLLNVAPASSIILLEDIDAAFVNRAESEKVQAAFDGLNRVTFSGLLNMLDGVASTEARIIFMTTNYIERLDPALIRPGRVDVREFVGYATDHQLRMSFENFYPNSSQSLVDQFIKNVRQYNNPVSMAMIQGYFMLFKDDPEKAAKCINLIDSSSRHGK